MRKISMFFKNTIVKSVALTILFCFYLLSIFCFLFGTVELRIKRRTIVFFEHIKK